MGVLVVESDSKANSTLRINSFFSLRPYLDSLRERAQRSTLYEWVLKQAEAQPALLEPQADPKAVAKHQPTLSLVGETLFPLHSLEEEMLAIGMPFQTTLLYYTPAFEALISHRDAHCGEKGGDQEEKLYQHSVRVLYDTILKKCYHSDRYLQDEAIFSFVDQENGTERFFRFRIDARYVDITHDGPLPDFSPIERAIALNSEGALDVLKEKLPLDGFRFEGFTIVSMEDITREEAVLQLKQVIISLQTQREIGQHDTDHIPLLLQSFFGSDQLKFNLLPNYLIQDKLPEVFEVRLSDFVLDGVQKEERVRLFREVLNYFDARRRQAIVLKAGKRGHSALPDLARYLKESDVAEVLLFPVYAEESLAGVFVVRTEDASLSLRPFVDVITTDLYQILILVFRAGMTALYNQVNEIITRHFTTIQPAVSWRFNQAAWNYLNQLKQEVAMPEMEKIDFPDLHAFYGAVDVRNSSLKRNEAMLKDIQVELEAAQRMAQAANMRLRLPVLTEIGYRSEQFLEALNGELKPEMEVQITDFIRQTIEPTVAHLYDNHPRLRTALAPYHDLMQSHSQSGTLSQIDYENSLQRVTAVINRFLDVESEKLLDIHPCYLEKYRTDGVEYNLYLGQSLAPSEPFHDVYLKNMVLWQIRTMIDIARQMHQLRSELPIELETTQLILLHRTPITLSFRPDERRFDVEGSYNVRYEILKKRIDKAEIVGTGERLTQPGAVAIVHSAPREVEEYQTYIDYLVDEGLLLPNAEYLELEEMQGVAGLHALRLWVNCD